MVEPPSELQWIMPKKSYYVGMSMTERAKGKKYKRPSEEVIFQVMEKIDLPIDDISKKSIEFLYDKSSTPSPYFPSHFSLYKTTHLVAEKIGNKKFRNTLRFKHLKWTLTKSREILETNPNLEEILKREKINFKEVLGNFAANYKEEKIRELLTNGRLVGYSQYSTNPVDAFEQNNISPWVEKPLLLTKGAQNLYSRFLNSLEEDSEISKRLFDFSELEITPIYEGFWRFYRHRVSVDLLFLHRHNLEEKRKTKISKKDVSKVLNRRLGFLLKENEDIETLINKKSSSSLQSF